MAVTDYAASGRGEWDDQDPDQFVGLQGQLVTDDTRTNVAQKMSRAGTVSKLRVRVVSSSSNGSVTVTLMDGGTATGVSVSVSSGTSSSTVEDTTNSYEFAAGDELSWRLQFPQTGSDSTTVQWIACEIGEASE